MIIFRKYQEKAIKDGLDFINNKKIKSKGVIVAPVGTGKSLIIAGIADKFEDKILVVQPNKELLVQNYGKYVALGNEASIYSASVGSKEIGHVTFATPMSIVNHFEKFKDVKLILIDEAHLQSSPSGAMGRFLKKFSSVKTLGLTATPVLLTQNMELGPHLVMVNRSRKSMWNKIIHITQISEIKDQWWAKLKYETPLMDEKNLEWNSTKSEYTEESIREFYADNDIENKVIEHIKNNNKESIIIFCPSIVDATSLHEKIEGSRIVTSMTNMDERNKIVEEFRDKKIRVLINVLVFTVGTDFPNLDSIYDCTPTASVARWYQKIGRIVRPDPNNPNKEGLIVDFANSHKRFGKIEDITFEEDKLYGWAMFSGKKLLTGISVSDIGKSEKKEEKEIESNYTFDFGKFRGKKVEDVPYWYIKWLRGNFDFGPQHKELKIALGI